MASVEDVLQRKGREVWTIDLGESLVEALALMHGKNIGALVVLEDGRPVGLVSERDFARRSAELDKRPGDLKVSEVMSEIRAEVEVERSSTLSRCMRLMTDRRVRHLLVKEGAEIVGIISIGDVVNTILAENESVIRHLESYIAGLR